MRQLRFAVFFLSLCACYLLASGFFEAFAATDNPARRSTTEQGKAEASTLLRQGKTVEAYDLYSLLLRETPDDDEVNIGLARSAMAASRPNQAVMAYERLLEKYPQEDALHKEIAQVYMALGDKDEAQRHLDRVTTTNGESGDWLARWEKNYNPVQFHGKIRAGVLFDSNANQGPASKTMSLGNFKVNVPGAKKKESIGAYGAFQLNAGYRLDQIGPWWLVGDAQGYARGNANNDLEHNDSRYWQWGRVSGGVRYLDSRNMLDMRLKMETFDYEFNQHVQAGGPELLYAHAVRSDIQLITRAGIDQRAYSIDNYRNGQYWQIGQYVRFLFGEQNHEFVVGGRYTGGAADRNNYSYDGWEGSLRFGFKLPHQFELAPFVSFAQEYYKGPATALETKDRRDDRLRVGTTLTYNINEAWSVEASYQYTDTYSTSSLYKYNQHIISTGIAWSF